MAMRFISSSGPTDEAEEQMASLAITKRKKNDSTRSVQSESGFRGSVGGGNFIVPALVWLGFDPKGASATTAFIVIFSSLSGFFGHAALGSTNWMLLLFSAIGSIAGALLGSWLLHRKLPAGQVKKGIGVVLYAIAVKMGWGLF
jgi:uncharacterized membrane protein YfcA